MNREYLKLSEAKAGMEIEIDGGFTCSDAGVALLHEDENGLFFYCENGHHYISDDDYHCIGIYAALQNVK